MKMSKNSRLNNIVLIYDSVPCHSHARKTQAYQAEEMSHVGKAEVWPLTDLTRTFWRFLWRDLDEEE